MRHSPEELKAISPNLRCLEDGWYMFVEGECVRTPKGTGFITVPLMPIGPAGWTYCHVILDGHKEDEPYRGTCSVDNTPDNVVSIE
jgi:hypothetical protein